MDLRQFTTEWLFNRFALAAVIFAMVFTVTGLLGLIEMVAAFMLYIISNQIILESVLGLRKFHYEEVALNHADDLWRFRIGNNVCYVTEDGARDVQEYLNQTINPTSDREDHYA